MKILLNRLAASTLSVSDALAGYPADNMLNASVEMPWRSATQITPVVDVAFVQPTYVAGVYLFGHNADAPQGIAVNQSFTASETVPTITSADDYGRRKTAMAINATLARLRVDVDPNSAGWGRKTAQLKFTCERVPELLAPSAAVNSYTYWKIWGGNYVIPANARLVYDVFIPSSNSVELSAPPNLLAPGGMDLQTADNVFARLITFDQSGRELGYAPQARDAWVTRTIDLSAFATKTLINATLACEANIPGKFEATYRTIRIESAASVELLRIWDGGATQSNVDGYSQNYCNQRVEPQGVPLDGAGSFSVGAMHIFSRAVDFTAPEYGFKIETLHANAREDFDNGDFITAKAGTRRDKLSGTFMVEKDALGSAGVAELLRAIREEVVVIDMSDVESHWIWAVKATGDADVRVKDFPRVLQIEFDFTEVC